MENTVFAENFKKTCHIFNIKKNIFSKNCATLLSCHLNFLSRCLKWSIRRWEYVACKCFVWKINDQLLRILFVDTHPGKSTESLCSWISVSSLFRENPTQKCVFYYIIFHVGYLDTGIPAGLIREFSIFTLQEKSFKYMLPRQKLNHLILKTFQVFQICVCKLMKCCNFSKYIFWCRDFISSSIKFVYVS